MSAIQIQSLQSLFLELTARDHVLAKGTGFVVRDEHHNFLVTNWHLVTGRDSRTGELLSKSTGAEPDALNIYHNGSHLGSTVMRREPLFSPDDPDDFDREPLWSTHPQYRQAVDVVALPLTQLDGVRIMPVEFHPEHPRVVLNVTSDVSVVGFPFGLRHHGKLAIWTRGSLATEPAIDYEGLPCFLIDARTREGQSGSPVWCFRDGSGTIAFENGSVQVGTGVPVSQPLGVYSGRINEKSDLGYVWRWSSVLEVVREARRNGASGGAFRGPGPASTRPS